MGEKPNLFTDRINALSLPITIKQPSQPPNQLDKNLKPKIYENNQY
ncbi:MAG: hypothetical protein WBA93_36040 [Microcoleaceae cyanobacterium]